MSLARPSETSMPHLDDAELLRYLDGEAEGVPLAAHAHVVACRECASRLALLRQRNAALSATLARAAIRPLDDDARERQRAAIEARVERALSERMERRSLMRTPWRSPWIRAAAGIVVAAGIAAAAPPVRAWIASRIAITTQPKLSARAPGAGTAEASSPGSEVFFAVPGAELTVTFGSRQRIGEIVVTRASGVRSSASVLGGSEELVVLPTGVRIVNEPSSGASYLLRAGTGVERVRVHILDGARESDTILIVPDTGSVRALLGQKLK